MFRVPVLDQFEYQPPVLNYRLIMPPSIVQKGYRYVVLSPAAGDWTGKDNCIATYLGTDGWEFTQPKHGMCVFAQEESNYFVFNSNSNKWIKLFDLLNKSILVETGTSYTVDDGSLNSSMVINLTATTFTVYLPNLTNVYDKSFIKISKVDTVDKLIIKSYTGQYIQKNLNTEIYNEEPFLVNITLVANPGLNIWEIQGGTGCWNMEID
jgi:hypothetical protein